MTKPDAPKPRSRVIAYTDGACSGNPGPGGWGAVLISGGHEKDLKGAEATTTNNRMELTAAIEALRALRHPCHVTLYTDSRYLVDGINQWLGAWKKRGWKTAERKPVKNVDLWQALDQALERHKVTFHWVRGHSGNDGNERADRLAREAIAEMLGK